MVEGSLEGRGRQTLLWLGFEIWRVLPVEFFDQWSGHPQLSCLHKCQQPISPCEKVNPFS